MITLYWVYAVAGAMFAAFALLGLADRANPHRWTTAAFWALLALSMWGGDWLGDLGNGVLLLGLVALAGLGGMGRGQGPVPDAVRRDRSARMGNRLFVIALIIPATALVGTFAFKQAPTWFDGKQATLIALALGVLIASLVGCLWLRAGPTEPLQQGRRLMDSVGWAAILPQMLASLGAVFALSGVGDVVGQIVSMAIPQGSLLGAVIAYGLGMALFTMVMGNAFAAFPVMTAAIGLPLLIRTYGGDPAIVCAIGMLAGFCGTLMTPMAANFNLVPAALLDLKDKHGVIKRQVGTAVPLLANLGKPADAAKAVELGAEGVGLFRTEFLFLSSSQAPTVDEQTTAYTELLAAFPGKKVVVRALDAGADKPLAFLNDAHEQNPALGLRGLRALRASEDILREQLTALANADAATDADLWVMAPMVSTVEETEYFVTIAKEYGIKTAGVMVEVPSSALLADKVLAHADFASIGTNDLTQYTLAADRLLGSVASFQDPWHPAVLQLVKATADGGAHNSKPVGICGEAAADPLLAVVLVGLGATTLSMAPTALADVRATLLNHSLDDAKRIAEAALAASDAASARAAAQDAAAHPKEN